MDEVISGLDLGDKPDWTTIDGACSKCSRSWSIVIEHDKFALVACRCPEARWAIGRIITSRNFRA